MRALGINSITGRREHDECRDWAFDGHDSAAVLVEDGEVIAAVEEERLSRIKHTNFYPRRSIRWVLEDSRTSWADVDLIAVNFSEPDLDEVASLGHIGWQPDRARFGSGRELVAAGLQREFGVAGLGPKVRFCSHHMAHAWSAFYPSGFDEALVVVIDGAGPDGQGGNACTLIGKARQGSDIEIIETYRSDLSLGNSYTLLSSVLGYRRFDEYKVMGLAPYGDPSVYRPLFSKFFELLGGGQYRLADPRTVRRSLVEAGLARAARRRHEPFTQMHRDYAAALQDWLETLVFHVVRHFHGATGLTKLCFAGGVAHNCTLNGKLLYSGLFEKVFVQPAAHDAGGAYGAAVSALFHERAALNRARATRLYTGPAIPSSRAIESDIAAWSRFVRFERLDDVEGVVASSLANGHIVGWVQGRAEFGPRALGNRSILGDPRPAENKARINEMVKKREGYRPFAPSVLEERMHDVFEVPANVADLSHMLYVVRVKQEFQQRLAAITHVDGTARIQSVSRMENPRYWKLIHEFDQLTGIPLLLNTSFNNNVEPIVTTVDEAIACYLTTELNYLVIGDYLISKKTPNPAPLSCLELTALIPPGRRLVRGEGCAGGKEEPAFALESTTTDFFLQKHVPISATLFSLLIEKTGHPLISPALESGLEDVELERLAREVMSLWERRVLTLLPTRNR